MASRRVVITGLGVSTCLGHDLEAVWAALLERRSGIKRLESMDPSGFHSQIGGELPAFSLGDFIPKAYRKSAKVMSRDIQIALIAAYQALTDAGLKTKCRIERGEVEGPPNLDPARFGANIGAGLICADLNELAGALATSVDESGQFSIRRWGNEGMTNLTPLWLLKFLPNMLACHVTIVHDAQAPSNTITCGEASSHLAIGEAFRTIQRGAADICICGGAESKVNCMGIMRQDLFGRLVHGCTDDPARACQPFGREARGTVIAEGGGLVILESLEHATSRGARIYGEIVGFGAACNTRSWKEADPQGRAIAAGMTTALREAGMGPADVSLICTFGSGIPAYDASEAAAALTVFGERLPSIPAMAVKGSFGNNGAGSGAIDLAAGVLAMRHHTVPPAGTEQLADGCPLRLVTARPVDARIDSIISTAYALSGGQTASLVVRRFAQ